MRALVYLEPGKVQVREVPEPSPGPGEILVRVASCGICGSDVHGYRSGIIAPGCVMGHEYAGWVEGLGEGVEAPSPGTLVAGNSVLSCGQCSWCRRGQENFCNDLRLLGVSADGAFAPLVAVPASSVVAAPGADPRILCLAEPLATAVRAVRSAPVFPGEAVLVTGGGPIGLLCLALLRAMGAAPVVVSEPREARQEAALALGADAVLDPRRQSLATYASSLPSGGFARVLECSGTPGALEEATGLLRPGGTLTLVGLCEEPVPTDFLGIISRELRLTSAYLNASDDFEVAIALLTSGRLQVETIIHLEVGLEEIPDLLEELAEGRGRGGAAAKVLVRPA